MRVLADTHALYWYLISPDRLSPRSLEVLGRAEASDGHRRVGPDIPESGYRSVASEVTGPFPAAATRSCGPLS